MNLETTFERMCESETPEYWHIYVAVKSRLKKSYFPFAHDALPYFTDHGIGHVTRMLEKLDAFFKPHLPLENVSKESTIDITNLNLLINAVLWHDIGNIYGQRVGHEKNIKSIFNPVKDFLYDDYCAEWIVKIAEAHSGEEAIHRVIDRQTVPLHNTILYPQFLAALLRISDEIEEDSRRVEGRIISTIPKQNEAYWNFCLINESIRPIYEQRTFGDRTQTSLKVKISAKIDKTKIWINWGKNSGTVKAIEEYIRRIQKINKERKYCNQFLTQAFYFRTIDSVDLCLNIYDEQKAINKISFVFDDRNGYNEFFNNNGVKTTLEKYKDEEGING